MGFENETYQFPKLLLTPFLCYLNILVCQNKCVADGVLCGVPMLANSVGDPVNNCQQDMGKHSSCRHLLFNLGKLLHNVQHIRLVLVQNICGEQLLARRHYQVTIRMVNLP